MIILTLAILIAVAYLVYKISDTHTRRKTLPPGPKPLSLIGNLHQHIKSEQWLLYDKWHKQYGPVITVKMGIRTVIFLNTHKAITDFLVKQGRTYCSPPKLHFIGDCMIRGSVPILLPQSKERRDVHRLFKSLLASKACRAYAPLQERESPRFILVLSVPDSLIPSPFNPWERAGATFHRRFTEFWKRRMQRGLDNPNWNWTRLVNDNKPQSLSTDELLYWIIELEFASIASTTVLIRSFMATAVANPDVTQQVRGEIDVVVGCKRLPTTDDQDKLPLLGAFIHELMRWRGTPPLSMPYQGQENVDYNGYRIPSNALVIANQWSLNMGPEVYQHPERFQPQRWLANPKLQKPFLFGHGRRVCPGEEFARNSLFITFAQILWAFDIVPASPTFGQSKVPGLSMGANEGTDELTFSLRDAGRLAVLECASRALTHDKDLLDNAAPAAAVV
ncbi:cytochrome P450 [Aspergillus undulatus]|uniref:cytochrome P450 n=1 Tax=Aspergillus undulatus TaxID=1810928 RepID=UPI003CCD64C5